MPHTTFYPLVEINKTMPDNMHVNLLEIPDGDMTYIDSVPGTGIFQRMMSDLSAEHLIPNVGELLKYPKKEDQRGYYSFQPDYVDTRIIQDTCIYPIVGPDDLEQIKRFRALHERHTKTMRIFR
jgi:hypothetical protein